MCASIAGMAIDISGGPSGAIERENASRLEALLKTRTVYYTRATVEVSYQLHDAVGRTRVLDSNPALILSHNEYHSDEN